MAPPCSDRSHQPQRHRVADALAGRYQGVDGQHLTCTDISLVRFRATLTGVNVSITGEVVQHGQVVAPAPKPYRSPRWPWWVLAVAWLAIVLMGVPGLMLALPIARDTIKAGKPPGTPLVAMYEWMFSLEDETRSGQMRADHTAVPSQRAKLAKQREALLSARAADIRNHPELSASPFS